MSQTTGTRRKDWTPDDDAHLRDLLDAGVSMTEIEIEVGRSRAAIMTRMTKLDLRSLDRGRHRVETGARDAILRRRSQGWQPSRIARQVGVRVEIVIDVIAEQSAREAERTGAPPPAPKPKKVDPEAERLAAARRRDKERDRRITEMAASGSTQREIADALQISSVGVDRRARRLRLRLREEAAPTPVISSPSASRSHHLLEVVATRHGVSVGDLRSESRLPHIMKARFEAAARLRDLGLSYPAIGRRLNRDHTTILYAVRRHSEMAAGDRA